eukprot:gene17812-biopygen12403
MKHDVSTIIQRPSLRAHFACVSLAFRNPNWVQTQVHSGGLSGVPGGFCRHGLAKSRDSHNGQLCVLATPRTRGTDTQPILFLATLREISSLSQGILSPFRLQQTLADCGAQVQADSVDSDGGLGRLVILVGLAGSGGLGLADSVDLADLVDSAGGLGGLGNLDPAHYTPVLAVNSTNSSATATVDKDPALVHPAKWRNVRPECKFELVAVASVLSFPWSGMLWHRNVVLLALGTQFGLRKASETQAK